MYTNEMKYTGRPDDSLQYELDIFEDACDRAGVPDGANARAFGTMLSDLALAHYIAMKQRGVRTFKTYWRECEPDLKRRNNNDRFSGDGSRRASMR